MGENLGIARKRAAVHVVLPTKLIDEDNRDRKIESSFDQNRTTFQLFLIGILISRHVVARGAPL